MILINLLPPELRRKEAPKLSLPDIPVKKTLLVVGAGILALQLLLSITAVFYSTRYAIAKHEAATLSSKLQSVNQAKKRISVVAKKMQDIRTLTEKNFYWASILNEISMTATRGIWLRSLTVEEATVQKKSKAGDIDVEGGKKTKKESLKKAAPEKKSADAKKKSDKKSDKGDSDKKKETTTETQRFLRLDGSCVGAAGQETALVGKYLKALRDDAYFKELFGDDINLSGMNQRKLGEADVFDFTIQCRFKKGKL